MRVSVPLFASTKPVTCLSMCGWTLKGILASMPTRSISLARPEVVNGAPRSLTKMKGDLASRFKARSARNSSPSNGCVAVSPPLALRRCRVPVSNSTSRPLQPAHL